MRSMPTPMLAATLASTVLTVAAMFAALSPSRDAHAAPGGPVLELAQAAPAVGPAFVDSFSVACTTSATAITAAPNNMLSYTCQNSSTTKVAVGDSGITDPTDAGFDSGDGLHPNATGAVAVKDAIVAACGAY
jgi:hypothetical protein